MNNKKTIHVSDYVCRQSFVRRFKHQEDRDVILGPTKLTESECKEKCLKMRNCFSILTCCSKNAYLCVTDTCTLFNGDIRDNDTNINVPSESCNVLRRNCNYGKES